MSCCGDSVKFRHVVVQPPYTIANCAISLGEDWMDPLPRILEGDEPLDLTSKTIEIFVRPVFDHLVLIRRLSTEDGSIVIDRALEGLASIRASRESLLSGPGAIPVGEWDHFCILSQPYQNAPSMVLRRELYRGRLVVSPARVS